MLNTKEIKEDFPIFENYKKRHGKGLVYLDSAASSQTPKQVVAAMDEYYFNHRSNVHRSPYTLGVEATNAYENARATVAKFINAEKKEVIFTPSSTFGVNMAVSMLEEFLNLNQNDELVTSIADHHSNFIPFQELAGRSGATLRVIPLSSTDLDYAVAERLIRSNTKIVTIPLASNVLGTIYDAKRVIALAKENGAVTIVDATAAIGHLDVDVRSLGCDFLFFSGHKILGPTGIGVLYGRAEILTQLRPSIFGGGIIKSVTEHETVYLDIPTRFEPGTPNISGAIGLAQAIEYINVLGIGAITEHIQQLVRYSYGRLERISGLQVMSEPDETRNIGMISFNIQGIESHDTAKFLDQESIAVRGGHHCAMPLMVNLNMLGVCRASFYIYNDQLDVDALVVGIEKIKKLYTQ